MEISVEKLIEYAVKYDTICDTYPESEYEGRSVVEDIIGYLHEDGLISPREEENYIYELRNNKLYKDD